MRMNEPLRCAALLLSLGWVQAAPAAWQTLGRVVHEQRDKAAIELTTSSHAHVRVSFVDVDVARIRMSPKGSFERDFSYALADTPGALPLDVQHKGDKIVLRAGADGSRVEITQAPELLIDVYDAAGNHVVGDDPARPIAFDAVTGAIETSKQRVATELYYGFGEKALPLSRHQQYMTMWNSDTPGYAPGLDPIYQSIPFFIALREGKSYGVFFDNTYRSYFDMGKTDASRYTFGANGGELNYYVFTGGRERSPANVLRDYTMLTGRGSLPPQWALGYQQSRYSYSPDAQVREIARTFRDKRIPIDVIYFDIGYMDGYRIFTWSPKDFPEPAKLLDELHAQGVHAVTIVDPGIKVDENFPIYRAGKNLYTRTASGDELHAEVWPGICAFPDFTNPDARTWFGSLYAGFLEQGVDGFWNDMNEPGVFVPSSWKLPVLVHDPAKTFPLDTRHDGDGLAGTHARYHNVYGMQMARATFEGLAKLRPQQRPFVLTRAGYAGVQRYSAVWTGDNASTWDHLGLSIPMLTSLSISGVPFVGADIGGFTGTPSAELYTRWLQAAALTPFMRTHSAIDTAPREPWTHGEKYAAINRASIELRYQLLPYLYTLFADSANSGIPPMRPLWFEYAQDVAATQVEDEFLLGKDLLVAPVVHEAQTQRRVYLPKGETWVDWWDGTPHAGGSAVDVAAPLDRLPLFVRAGAAIPTSPPAQNTRDAAKLPLIVRIALGADGGGRVYQDAGDGFGYRKGDSEISAITLHGNRVHIDSPSHARFRQIAALEFIGVDKPPGAVTIDGKASTGAHFDAATRRLRVELPARRVSDIELQR